MNTQRIRPWLISLACLGLLVSCAKQPCGKPLEKTPDSITGTQWKLTRSTDAGVNNILTPFTFSVFNFGISGDAEGFTGTIQRAVNNVLQQAEQAQRFYYEVDPRQKLLSLDLIPTSSQVTADPVSKDYAYKLSRRGLELQDLDTGDVYNFCPFSGADAPDKIFP